MNNQRYEKINFFSRNECPILLLVIIGVLAYANSFTCPFIFDDTSAIKDNPYIKNLWPLSEAMSAPFQSPVAGRPIAALTMAFNYALSGYSVWSYHLLNLIIHLLAAVTLYTIVRRTLLSSRLKQNFGNRAIPLAWAIAAVWLVHPLQTESVTYIVQRTESLMGLFYLLTLYTAIRSIQSRTPAIWAAVSVACCALGMATKEVMVTAPLLVLLYDRVFAAGSFKSALKNRWVFYIGLAATWAVLFTLMSVGPRSNTVGFDIRVGPLTYALSQFGIVVHYLRLCFWPAGLCLDYRWPAATTLGRIVPPMLVILSLLALTLYSLIRNRSWSYPLAWFFAILAPTSSFVPITDLAFEHRMYLPLAAVVTLFIIGGYVLLGNMANRLKLPANIIDRRIGAVVVTVLIVVLALATTNRNRDYKSAESIWQKTIAIAPHNPRAHTNLGIALQSKGKFNEALYCYYQALKVAPNYVDAHNNIGLLMELQGKSDQAISHYRQALQIKPDYAEAYNNLGLIFQSQDKPDEALDYFNRASQLKPYDADIQNNLGVAFLSKGEPDKAIRCFRRALKLRPDSAQANSNLGYSLMSMGSFDQAALYFKNALQIQSDYFSPLTGLAWILATHPDPKVRDVNLAIALAERAAALTNNRNAMVLNTLAAAYAAAGQLDQATKYYHKALQIDPNIKPSEELEALLKPPK